MKKMLVLLLIGFGLSAYAQNVKKASLYMALDANVPISDFAAGSYEIAGGAEMYKKDGMFGPALGFTLGVEIPISSGLAFRPTGSVTSYNGSYYVGSIDRPKMKLFEVRVGADLVYYVNGMFNNSFYFLGTAGYNIEKLNVHRVEFQERFDSKRTSAGVGVGYAFGFNQSMNVEFTASKSISGTPPADASFPDLSVCKLSFGFRF